MGIAKQLVAGALTLAVGASAGYGIVKGIENKDNIKASYENVLSANSNAEKLKQVETELAEANEQVTLLTAEKEERETELATVNARIVALNATIATNNTTIANLQRANAQLEAQAEDNAETIATKNETINALKEDIALKTNDLSNANATINEQVATINSQATQIENLTAFKYGKYVDVENDTYIEILDNGKVKLYEDTENFVMLDYSIENEVISVTYENVILQFEIISNMSIQTTVENETTKFVYLTEELEETLNEKRNIQTSLSSAQVELNNTQNQVATLQAQAEIDAQTIASNEAIITGLTATNESYESDIAEYEAQIEELQGQLTSLQNQPIQREIDNAILTYKGEGYNLEFGRFYYSRDLTLYSIFGGFVDFNNLNNCILNNHIQEIHTYNAYVLNIDNVDNNFQTNDEFYYSLPYLFTDLGDVAFVDDNYVKPFVIINNNYSLSDYSDDTIFALSNYSFELYSNSELDEILSSYTIGEPSIVWSDGSAHYFSEDYSGRIIKSVTIHFTTDAEPISQDASTGSGTDMSGD